MKYFFTFLLVLSFFIGNSQDLIERTKKGISPIENADAQVSNGLSSRLIELKQLNTRRNTPSFALFKANNQRQSLPTNIEKGVALDLQKEVLAEIRNQASPLINLRIPVGETAFFELDLFKANIHTEGFKVTTSTPVNQELEANGIFYQGIVKGNSNSTVAVSIFENLAAIYIQDARGNYKVIKDVNTGAYMLYNHQNKITDYKFKCDTKEIDYQQQTIQQPTAGHARNSTSLTVEIYIETDYGFYLEMNEDINVVRNYIDAMMNESVAIFATIEIPISMSDLKIHTTTDPYADGEDTSEKFELFANELKDTYPGRLAHLISGDVGGGIASLDVLCNTFIDEEEDGAGPYAVTGIGEFVTTPDMEDVNTFVHELGHNFGSHHTQACFWNGNLTAIDGCVDVEGLAGEEPTCGRPNMDCPSGGGTIMSYCSISDDVDCFIVNKWHPQVATYIKDRYEAANSMGCFGIDQCADNGGDADQDGICADNDCNDNDATIGAKQAAGTACDDGNPMTENDVIQADGCGCAGTLIDPCADNGGDADEDGICADNDCNDNDATIGAKQAAGTACDDGNAMTENDVIQADGCGCAGTLIDPCADNGGDADEDGICADNDCNDNDATIGAKQAAGTACDDGNPMTENDVIQADGCGCAGTLIDPCADNGGDADQDGICADNDCNDNDATIGAKQAAGTACDDGNSMTENDVIQADGCGCAGTAIMTDPCADNGGDADQDGICADNDCDDTDAMIGAKQAAGTACDDGNAMTENDVIQADGCGCAGTMIPNNDCAAPTNPVVIGTGARKVQVSWAAIPNAINYTIQIRFLGQERWLVTAEIPSNRVNLYGPQKEFEYRIKSNCAGGSSEYGVIESFSIPTATLVNPTASSRDNNIVEIAIKEAASLYPNPVKNTVNLAFPTVSNQTQFIIYNIAGKEVYRQSMTIDINNYAFNLDHLEAGFYFGVVLENGKTSYTEKFVKH